MGTETKTPRHESIEQLTWSASVLSPRDMPAGVYKALLFQLVLATTNTGGAALTGYDIATAIDRLEILLNGKDTLLTIPGYHLYFQNKYDYSIDPISTIDTVEGSSKTQKLDLLLPFALTRAAIPSDTILDLRPSAGITSAKLNMTWADASIGTSVTITSGSCKLTSWIYDINQALKVGRHEYAYTTHNLDKTGNVDIKLPYGGGPTGNQYRRLWLYTFNNSGSLNSSQVSNVLIKAGSYTWHDIAADMLQNDNARQYSVTPEAGVYVLDLTTDGIMSERLDARYLNSELILRLTSLVTNGTVHVVAEHVIG